MTEVKSHKIKLTCPKHGKEFTVDELNSSYCPYCGDWIDVNGLRLYYSRRLQQDLETRRQNQNICLCCAVLGILYAAFSLVFVVVGKSAVGVIFALLSVVLMALSLAIWRFKLRFGETEVGWTYGSAPRSSESQPE